MEEFDLMLEIFCTREQIVTPHQGYVDQNGEYVFECQAPLGTKTVKDPQTGEEKEQPVFCDRFVKFPADTTEEQFASMLQNHEDHNFGQITMHEQNKKLRHLIGGITLKQAEVVQPEAQPEQPQPEEHHA